LNSKKNQKNFQKKRDKKKFWILDAFIGPVLKQESSEMDLKKKEKKKKRKQIIQVLKACKTISHCIPPTLPISPWPIPYS